jgi:hypothetical protein
MTNKHKLKTALQIYAGFYGLIGILIFLLLGVFVIKTIRLQEGDILLLLLCLLPLSISAILFYISYETIFVFSEKCIGNLSGLTGLSLYLLSDYLIKFMAIKISIFPMQLLIKSVPYIVGLLSYSLIKMVLSKVAKRNELF